MTCVAEFIGGGVQPWFRVDTFKLFADLDGFGFVTLVGKKESREVSPPIQSFFFFFRVQN